MEYTRSSRQRYLQHLAHRLGDAALASRVIGPIARKAPAWAARWPSPPNRRSSRRYSSVWPTYDLDPPEPLRRVAGIRRDPQAEAEAYAARPLRDFFRAHADSVQVLQHMLLARTSSGPRLTHATARIRAAQADVEPRAPRAPQVSPIRLTGQLKQEAARLGISSIGVAQYDPKYTFEEYRGLAVGERVVVCTLEQSYDATQRIPAVKSEHAALSTYGELEDRMVALAGWLRDRGFRARPDTFLGESMFIHYAVEAGLGQLGLNGQLLTPQAGSRCRINVLTTDAPLELDHPVDFGIEGVCDECQICVRRCPVGAIPNRRREHRGITKIKINTKRCLPLVGQAAGCSVCMKVCPVQRFGLAAVLDEYQESGKILGKDTDDLEGYDWPLDGKHYPPGRTPRVPDHILSPPGFSYDPDRMLPIVPVARPAGS